MLVLPQTSPAVMGRYPTAVEYLVIINNFSMLLTIHFLGRCHMALTTACHGTNAEFERDNVPWHTPRRNHRRAIW